MSFELVQAETLEETLQNLSEHGYDAKVLAGGTAIVLLLQQRLIAPGILLDVGDVPDLAYIRDEDGALHLGPLTRLRDIERSETIQGKYAGLAKAVGSVGNVRIRNQATIGGNLAEADYASDPPAMLLALDAEVTVRSKNETRTQPLSEFLIGFYATTLQPEELITGITIPNGQDFKTTYLKFRTRSSEDRPCVGVAVAAAFKDELCTDLRVAVGAATEVPRRLPETEALAHGEPLDDALIAEIAEGYASELETVDDLRGSAWYRTQMIRVNVRRALEEIRDARR